MALILRDRYDIAAETTAVLATMDEVGQENVLFAPTGDYEHSMTLGGLPPSVSERSTAAQERIKWPLVLLIAVGLDILGFCIAYAWRAIP